MEGTIGELTDRFGQLITDLKAATTALDEAQTKNEGSIGELSGKVQGIATEVADVKAKLDEAAEQESARKTLADAKALLDQMHAPSKAGAIGPGRSDAAGQPVNGLFGSGYAKGTFLNAILAMHSHDPEAYMAGKARLAELGVAFGDVPALSKATLGDAGATGGYVLPNNLVEQVEKPKTQQAVYTASGDPLLTIRTGVNVRGVDQPFRTGSPARMQVQTWGEKKTNVDEAYGTYAATLYTIGKIYDLGKQYLRFSGGSAETDVLDELSKSAALGENYYVMLGAGTTEPYGVLPALLAGNVTYHTAHSPVGNTILGSAATAFAKMLGALGDRSQTASAIVMRTVDYWTMLAQGSDTAGFWVAPEAGPAGFTRTASGGLAFWGVPIFFDANLTTKYAVAGDWKALKFYRGAEFRVDTSDQAGERWDRNEVGFRGEEEIAVNAATATSVGAFQYTDTIVP